MASGVTVDNRSVHRAWTRADHHEFWIEVRTQAGSDTTFGDTINRLNDRHKDQDGPFAQLNTRSPHGFVAMVSHVHDDADLDNWLNQLAADLDAHGFEGTVRGIRSTRAPTWLDPVKSFVAGQDPELHPPESTAFVRWTVDTDAMATDPKRRSHWHVAPDATDRVCQHLVDWTGPGGSRIVLSQDTFRFEISDDLHVATTLAANAMRSGMTSVIRFNDRPQAGRAAYLAPGGQTVLQEITAHAAWREQVETLRAAIVALPALTDQAFIRPALRYAISWSHLDGAQPLPHLTSTDVRANPHLLDQYVPDAHGIQILRDQHLAHAHDLSNWSITNLDDGRHLVEAPDLAAWYGAPLPEREVVEQARRDFGPLILDQATVDANPPPWR